MKPTTTPVIARLIRDNRTTVKDPNTNDPLKLITTKEDIISFPSVDCTLHTTRVDDISYGNYEFVILISKDGEEKHYVFQLQKGDDNARRCICYEPLSDWDTDAKLIKH